MTYNQGYCEFVPRSKSSNVDLWELYLNRKGSWTYWLSIISDEGRVVNIYNEKYQSPAVNQSFKPSSANKRYLIRSLLTKKIVDHR